MAFCYSNRTDSTAISIFFTAIKERVTDLSTKVFMPDDAPSYYNVFESVFGKSDFRLLCSWHVKNSWLKNWCKIQDLKLREEKKEKLKAIYDESNEAAFEIQLDSLMEELLNDSRTKAFTEYFIQHYSGRRKEWAPCYRKGLHLNTNMHLENMHRLVFSPQACTSYFISTIRKLKHIYMDGKRVKRLDKSIQSLMDILRDFAHKRSLKIRKGYQGYKVFKIDKSHKRSEEISFLLVESSDERGKHWSIQSTTIINDIHVYEMRKGDPDCQCQLRCKNVICAFIQ